jgi:uncharacterized protein YbbK (DUF523 family)
MRVNDHICKTVILPSHSPSCTQVKLRNWRTSGLIMQYKPVSGLLRGAQPKYSEVDAETWLYEQNPVTRNLVC